MTHGRMLSHEEIRKRDLVEGFREKAARATTYDASIGCFISKAGKLESKVYELKPRAIVWLVSQETFKLPSSITGISTLKTELTRKGLLTLTVGIVDPGYQGPLSTAIVNFSSKTHILHIDDPFLRTVFFEHEELDIVNDHREWSQYIKQIEKDTSGFSESFLTIDSLATEIGPKIIGMPRWSLLVGVTGLAVATILALYSLILPPVLGISTEIHKKNSEISLLKERIEKLESR